MLSRIRLTQNLLKKNTKPLFLLLSSFRRPVPSLWSVPSMLPNRGNAEMMRKLYFCAFSSLWWTKIIITTPTTSSRESKEADWTHAEVCVNQTNRSVFHQTILVWTFFECRTNVNRWNSVAVFFLLFALSQTLDDLFVDKMCVNALFRSGRVIWADGWWPAWRRSAQEGRPERLLGSLKFFSNEFIWILAQRIVQ